MMNRITIAGTAEDLRHGQSKTTGHPWATFKIRWDKPNAKKEPEFVLFSAIAFNISAWKVIHFPDQQFVIDGRLRSKDLTTKDGRQITITEIIVEHVEIVRPRDVVEAEIAAANGETPPEPAPVSVPSDDEPPF